MNLFLFVILSFFSLYSKAQETPINHNNQHNNFDFNSEQLPPKLNVGAHSIYLLYFEAQISPQSTVGFGINNRKLDRKAGYAFHSSFGSYSNFTHTEIRSNTLGLFYTYYFKNVGVSSYYLSSDIGFEDFSVLEFYDQNPSRFSSNGKKLFATIKWGKRFYWRDINAQVGIGYIKYSSNSIDTTDGLSNKQISVASTPLLIDLGVGVTF